MMNEKIEDEKNNIDDFMLPGFRFHPTDEELVGFYLKRKLQQRSLPIELIKQVDIYKYDPWDLPKLASTGEKEWYFYCPRDRKYRNSTRPNRVTGSGFWKATGTDRPIYSSDGTRCIGLKKSLVFYRGRAAKGFKTDWMMHEFRLPSAADAGAPPPKKICSDKNIPATDSWAICRIFKKITSMANRVHSHSWNVSLSDQTTSPDHAFTYTQHHTQNLNVFSTSSNVGYFPENFVFSPTADNSGTTSKSTTDYTSMPFSPSSSAFIAKSSECLEFEGSQQHFNGLSTSTSLTQLMHEDDQEHLRKNTSATNIHINPLRSMGFPFSLPPADSWKPNNLPWDSPAPCPSEISSGAYSTNKCYT